MIQAYEVDAFGIFEKILAVIVTLLALAALGTPKSETVVVNFDVVILTAISMLCLAGVILLGFKLRKRSPVEVFGFGRGFLKELLWKIPVGWVVLTLVGLGAKLALESGGSGEEARMIFEGGGGMEGPLKMFVGVVIIIPVAEEIIFRGLVYGVAKKAFGFGFGAVASAVVFAIAHNDFTAIPHFIGLSLFAIWLLERTQSLWPSILLHSLNNLFVFVVMAFQHDGFDFVPK